MAIQYGPGYDPADQPTPEGSGFQTVVAWNDLRALEPAAEGREVLLSSGIPGSPITGSVLVRRYATSWNVPGCDQDGLLYLAQNPIPQMALTIPGPWELDGGIPDVYGSSSIGGYMANWGAPTATAATTAHVLYNTTTQNVNRLKIAVMSSTVNTVALSAKLKLGAEPTSAAGPWTGVTFAGQPSIVLNGTEAGATIAWSDIITLPGTLAPGDSITIWMSGSGESTSSLPLSNGFRYTEWKETTGSVASYLSVGNGVAGDTMSWLLIGSSIGISKVAWGFEDTSKTVVNIVAFGDSTFSMFNGWNQPADFNANGYQGWSYSANKLARTSNKNYRITSLGRGSVDLYQYRDIALAAIPGLVGIADVIAFQPWTGNSPTVAATKAAHLQVTAQIKAACDLAGISFMPLTMNLPADGIWDGTAYTGGSMTEENIQYYYEMKADITSLYPSYLDVSDVLVDASGHHHLRIDSPDDNHCYTSNDTERVGQWKVGNAINETILPKLQTLGYAV